MNLAPPSPRARPARPFALMALGVALVLALPRAHSAEGAEARLPNIVFAIADDLGYGDLGCYGQKKIRTPNLDRLAAEGMRLLVHYSGNAVCAPSRCVLMTGRHPGHAYIRDNREKKPEGQEPLPADTVTLPRLLRAAGYVTGAFGKWGLGGPGTTGDPLAQGFERFYGYNCQRLAHNFYPTHLWDNDRRVELGNPDFSAHQRLPRGADPKSGAAYQGYTGKVYAPDLISEQAREFIRTHRTRPFFLFYPTTVPHLALQVPEDSLAEYVGAFAEEPYLGDRGYLPHPTPRAAYAAMVSRLDREIGRMVDLVRDLGLEERTLFIFTSDNGPLYDRLGGTDTDFFDSASGLRGRKGSLYEGGIRVPAIVRWKGRIAPGTTSNRVTGFEDWLPTLLELVGAKSRVPPDVDGLSFAPTLLGQGQEPRRFLYREFPGYRGQQMIRIGDWKAVRQQLNGLVEGGLNAGRLELFHLGEDPGETRDLAAIESDIVARLSRMLHEQHTASPLFPIRALDGERR